MKIHPRSSWTSRIPQERPVGITGLPYFTKYPVGEIFFERLKTNTLAVYRDPKEILETLLREAFSDGQSDINYNFAISQNVEGVYTIRGLTSRCTDQPGYKVLMLLGQNEDPTDLLKKNQKNLVKLLSQEKIYVEAPKPAIKPNSANIHVFDLLEYLHSKGALSTHNNARYTEVVEFAVKAFQDKIGVETTGVWDTQTYMRCLRK